MSLLNVLRFEYRAGRCRHIPGEAPGPQENSALPVATEQRLRAPIDEQEDWQ
jgi:hypothetical protein